MDIASRDSSAPNPHKIPYGQAIDGINNAKELLQDMGTGGTYLQLQSKQAITCSLLKLDDHNNVRNMKLMRKVLPHTYGTCRKDWVNKCASYLTNYRRNVSNVFVNKYENITRNS